MILIDEPGGNLHATVQKDVLKVFEDLKDKINIVYTTHSPFLLDINSIYRLIAVQREEETTDFKYKTYFCYQLGQASNDTLLLLYATIESEFYHQQTIQ
ncbi:MAG: ATP-binding protein [Bdellovibrionales bacterium]|nr:ATP-binding protein [Bdellovibrionales bacterium]